MILTQEVIGKFLLNMSFQDITTELSLGIEITWISKFTILVKVFGVRFLSLAIKVLSEKPCVCINPPFSRFSK